MHRTNNNARGPPREVAKILQEVRKADLSDPATKSSLRQKLMRLARTKKAWYTLIVTLAMGATGLVVVKKYAELENLKGVGEATVSLLESAGEKLGITHSLFKEGRLAYLERQQGRYLKMAVQGKMDPTEAVEQYVNLFNQNDPWGLWMTMGHSLASKIEDAMMR